jgi:hypothetical protein
VPRKSTIMFTIIGGLFLLIGYDLYQINQHVNDSYRQVLAPYDQCKDDFKGVRLSAARQDDVDEVVIYFDVPEAIQPNLKEAVEYKIHEGFKKNPCFEVPWAAIRNAFPQARNLDYVQAVAFPGRDQGEKILPRLRKLVEESGITVLETRTQY